MRPEGMWLAERVWEPALAKLIADAGMQFTLVDDGHFRAAGPRRARCAATTSPRRPARRWRIFPIDKKLREAIPFLKAWETLEVLEQLGARRRRRRASPTATTARSSASGRTPRSGCGTRAGCASSCACSGERRDAASRRAHFGEYLDTHRPTGRVYLPTASYEEMGEWALPADAQQHYNAGAQAAARIAASSSAARAVLARRHLAELPRQVSRGQLHAQEDGAASRTSWRAPRRSSARRAAHPLDHARRELYRAQCNCCYWHGLFGGLYLNYLRDAVYRHLIEAEVAGRARARHRRRAAASVESTSTPTCSPRCCCTTRGRRPTSSPTSAAACSSSIIGPSASTCSTCSAGAPRAITGGSSRRRARRTTADGGPGLDPRSERGQVGGARGSVELRPPSRGSPSSITSCGRDDARRRWRAATTASDGDFAGAPYRARRSQRRRRRGPRCCCGARGTPADARSRSTRRSRSRGRR